MDQPDEQRHPVFVCGAGRLPNQPVGLENFIPTADTSQALIL